MIEFLSVTIVKTQLSGPRHFGKLNNICQSLKT